jgi:hypothetical protein
MKPRGHGRIGQLSDGAFRLGLRELGCTAVCCPSWSFRTGTSPWKQKRRLA